ncbi:hypothetical protein MKX03_036007 [Papaver bracteatum]|nr:hypothetical protein MKX03_036007 [Papaver bracteatum]
MEYLAPRALIVCIVSDIHSTRKVGSEHLLEMNQKENLKCAVDVLIRISWKQRSLSFMVDDRQGSVKLNVP